MRKENQFLRTDSPIRIYTPISKYQCIATPYIVVKGKESYDPMPEGALPEIELIEDVVSNGGIVDSDYSLVAGKNGHSEGGQIELIIKYDDSEENKELPSKAIVKIGVDDKTLPIFGESTVIPKYLEIGGTYGESTLEVIAGLARERGSLIFNSIHFDADNDKHFTGRIRERQFLHDGTSAGEKPHPYPRSNSGDLQTTIREIIGMNAHLDGFGWLEMPVHKGVGVNMVIDTTSVK